MHPIFQITNPEYQQRLETFREQLKAKLQGNTKAALGIKIGGSGANIIARANDGTTINEFKFDILNAKTTNEHDKQKAVREMFLAIACAKQIFAEVANQAKQSILPFIDSLCGYPLTDKNPDANQQTPIIGDHYLRNLDRGQTIISGCTEPELSILPPAELETPNSHNRVYNLRALNRFPAEAVGLAFDLDYTDDLGKHYLGNDLGNRQASAKKVTIKARATNDTILVARSAAEKPDSDPLQEGENIVGLVCGSGFNVGVCKGYKGDDEFTEIINTEIGGETKGTENLKDYLLTVDAGQAYLGERLTLENLLACSKIGKMGLESRINTIYEIVKQGASVATSNALSILNRSAKLFGEGDSYIPNATVLKAGAFALANLARSTKNKGSYRDAITDALKPTNAPRPEAKFAFALCALQLDQITSVLSRGTLGKTMRDPKTTKLALTGSWIVNIIDALGTDGKLMFANLLNQKLGRTGATAIKVNNIVLYRDKEQDGMINYLDSSLIKAQAAVAKLRTA